LDSFKLLVIANPLDDFDEPDADKRHLAKMS
jgi:hypothetical protein